MTAPEQTANQYRAEQIAAAAAAAAAAYQAASLAGYSLSNFTVWSRLIRLLFDVVSRQRVSSAFSARQFFDSERLRVTGLPRLDVPLVGYDIQRFEKAMRPAYDMVVKQLAVVRELEKQGLPQPKPRTASTVSVLAAREVSAAGREQTKAGVRADNELIAQTRMTWGGNTVTEMVPKPVELDQLDREVVGWARVPTGEETCAFCIMLCSRGPVYMFGDTAGLLKDSTVTEAVAAFKLKGSTDEFRPEESDRWHPGCDCTIVPVFDKNEDWPGKQQAKDAMEVWKQAGRAVEYDPNKLYREQVVGKDGKITYKMVKLSEAAAINRETLANVRAIITGKDPSDRYKVSQDTLEELLKAVPGAAKLFKKELARR
jgi:hypothetical protein